jgi:hypothetical protein
MRRAPLRVLAGRVTAHVGDRVTVELATDVDTGETLEVEAQHLSAPADGQTSYVSSGPDGAVNLSTPTGGPGGEITVRFDTYDELLAGIVVQPS